MRKSQLYAGFFAFCLQAAKISGLSQDIEFATLATSVLGAFNHLDGVSLNINQLAVG